VYWASFIVILTLDNLRDTNLTITFTNNLSLMYSIDVDLYEPGMTYTIEEGELTYSLTGDLVASGRVQSIAFVLWTGTSYQIYIRNGDNVDAMVTFGNGAMLRSRDFGYSCTGTFDDAVYESPRGF